MRDTLEILRIARVANGWIVRSETSNTRYVYTNADELAEQVKRWAAESEEKSK